MLALGALLVGSVALGAQWPPFLPPAAAYPEPVVAGVESAFGAPTLVRTVQAEPAPVPPGAYLTFVDAPDVTAAAARHLGLARYDVHRLGPDRYQADDGDGNRGAYRVLLREGGRRVILSWGSHSGWIIGRIHGHALSVLDFEPHDRQTAQRITAYVHIDNAVAAALARALAPLFGGLIDRKLTEGFRVTARVAEWALGQPAEFCAWLVAHEPSLTGWLADLPAPPATCVTGSPDHAAVSRTP